MGLTDYIVPLLLAGTAVCALARRVDVYAALTAGAGEGLRVMARICPALIGLLTAVGMFRASGAMDVLAGVLAPLLRLLGIPPETAALLLVRPVSGSGALAVGSELMGGLRRGFLHRARRGGHARLHGDDVLYHRRLLRCGRYPPHAIYRPRSPHSGPHRLHRRRPERPPLLRHINAKRSENSIGKRALLFSQWKAKEPQTSSAALSLSPYPP